MDAQDVARLREREMRIYDPAVRGRREEVAALLADDFLEITASGQILDRQQIIDALAAEQANASPVRQEVSAFTARWIGPDLALALYRITRTGSPDAAEAHSLRSTTWRFTGGQWRMIFHQGTPVPAP